MVLYGPNLGMAVLPWLGAMLKPLGILIDGFFDM
jgi:hypothetical protein